MLISIGARKLIRYPLFACLALAVLSATAAPYKWVDQNGQVHYSQVPPTHLKSTEINVAIQQAKAPKTKAVTKSDDQPDKTEAEIIEDAEEEKQRLVQVAQRRKESCIDAKHNLMVLENNNHVREKIDGEYSVLSQQEREKRIQRLTNQTRDLCQ